MADRRSTRGTQSWILGGLRRPPSSTLPTSRLAVLLSAVVGLAACSSGAVPNQTTVAVLPTATPIVTPGISPRPPPTPRASPLIVKITPIPGAPDSGVVVKLTTNTDLWSVDHIDAPAGKGWHVQIGDLNGGTHNFTVASGPTVPERIYMSPRFDLRGGTFTYDIPALPAGSYLFICTLHPQRMSGTLTIGG